MRRIPLMLALVLVAPAWAAASPAAAPPAQEHSHGAHAGYVCPMHADVVAKGPGTCPRCGMPLTRVDPRDAGTYRLELKTRPQQVRAGEPFTLELAVRRQDSEQLVTDFTVVHEKPFHLFIISSDLENYFHLHPAVTASGIRVENLTLPRPLKYMLYADVLPKGATPQVLTEVLEIDGTAGNGTERSSSVQVDTNLERTVGNLRVRLSLPAGGLTTGDHQALTFRFTDARTGAPVQSIQPYLGAWGHTVMLSEDMQHFVHAHPSEPLSGAYGGPQLTFHAAPSAAGTYRIWTQIMRQGRVETIVFTVLVKPPT